IWSDLQSWLFHAQILSITAIFVNINKRAFNFSRKLLILNDAGVAKLADAPDLGSGGEIHRGSNPLPGISSAIPTPNPQRSIQASASWALEVGHWTLSVEQITARGH